MIYCVTSQKGGVGKSTTVDALSCGLKKRGYSVLVIDMDPQGTLSDYFRADMNKPTILDVMLKKALITDSIQHTTKGDVIAYSNQLSNADKLLTKTKDFPLQKALESVKDLYDFILIDTPPTLSAITVNSLVASDRVLIPTIADRESIRGISQLIDTIRAIQTLQNPNLKIEGILINSQPPRSIFSNKMTNFLDKDYSNTLGVKVFNTRIRQAVAIKEAHGLGADLFDHAPHSGIVRDYNNFIDEFLRGNK